MEEIIQLKVIELEESKETQKRVGEILELEVIEFEENRETESGELAFFRCTCSCTTCC